MDTWETAAGRLISQMNEQLQRDDARRAAAQAEIKAARIESQRRVDEALRRANKALSAFSR